MTFYKLTFVRNFTHYTLHNAHSIKYAAGFIVSILHDQNIFTLHYIFRIFLITYFVKKKAQLLNKSSLPFEPFTILPPFIKHYLYFKFIKFVEFIFTFNELYHYFFISFQIFVIYQDTISHNFFNYDI